MIPEPIGDRYESYLRDESGLAGTAGGILFPQNTAALAEALAAAGAGQLPLTLQGARTGVVGGALPEGGLVVNLSRMNRLLGLRREAGRWFLRVEAGVTLEQLDAFCARPAPGAFEDAASAKAAEELAKERRVFFPANPTEASATLGGVYAGGAGGPLGLAYGPAAGHVAAARWVTPAGEVWDIRRGEYRFTETGCPLPGGAPLCCESAGPGHPFLPAPGTDLLDFLAGTEGALGALAELELALLPQPRETWALVCFFEEEQQALAFAGKLQAWRAGPAGGALQAAEFLDGAALALLDSGRGQNPFVKSLPAFPARRGAALCLELAGDDPDALEAALLAVLALFEEAGGDEQDTWAFNDAQGLRRLRDMRHALPEMLGGEWAKNPQFGRIETDYAAPPEQVEQTCKMYREGLAGAGLPGCVYGHILQNTLHVALLPQTPAGAGAAASLAEGWGKWVLAQGGQIAAENGVGKLKRPLACRLLPPGQKKFLQGVKQHFDPQGRMEFSR